MGKAVFRMVMDAAAASEAAGGSAAALPAGPKVIKPAGLLRRLMDEQVGRRAGSRQARIVAHVCKSLMKMQQRERAQMLRCW